MKYDSDVLEISSNGFTNDETPSLEAYNEFMEKYEFEPFRG